MGMSAGAVVNETDESVRGVGLPEGPLNEIFGPFDFVSLTGHSREADLEIIVRAGRQARVIGWSAARLNGKRKI
jgi:hypothetical protein